MDQSLEALPMTTLTPRRGTAPAALAVVALGAAPLTGP